MKTAQEIFSEVLSILERLKIEYMIGGSIAAIAFGEPRLTLDMDIVVDLNSNQARLMIKAFEPEYYINLESILTAISDTGHFNVIQSEAGVKIDFYILGRDEFSREQFKRRKNEAFAEGRGAIFCSPEDIILKKLEWYKIGQSQKHLTDITGILKISGNKLDFKYIDKWAAKLGVMDLWQKLVDENGKIQ